MPKHIVDKVAIGSITSFNLELMAVTLYDLADHDCQRQFRESILNAELTLDIDPETGKTKITHIDGRVVAG
jgi:hypothetical protein